MRQSTYHIPKMDCPAEEQLIRLALGDSEGIAQLQFDLSHRTLVVQHTISSDKITNVLAGLNLGATLVQSIDGAAEHVGDAHALAGDGDEARVLWTMLAINGLMFVGELTAGWLVESTGLIADSLDMLADATVYGLSLYAVGKTVRHKLRAARLSGWFQLVLALGAFTEVGRRSLVGSEPLPLYMIGVATVALVANVTCLWLIAKHRHGEAHMKASWIFSTNDVIANLGVIAAGILVSITGSRYPDLAIGLLIAAIVLVGSIRILKLK